MNTAAGNVHRDSQAGFTLVEALVSLFVFSLIAAGCVAMLMQSVASQRAVLEVQGSLRELEAARSLLSADVIQIAPRATREADNSFRPMFQGVAGSEGALSFVRSSADSFVDGAPIGSLTAVAYAFRDGALVRRSRRALDPTPNGTFSERIVFRNIEDGRFEFYDGAVWRRDWLADGSSSALPRAVALVGRVPRYGVVRIEALVYPAS